MVKRQYLDISIFLIVFAVSITYFILKTYNAPALFSATLAFTVMASVSLFAALYTQSEEAYYENLDFMGLIYVVLALGGMIAVGSLFIGIFGASVLYYPTVFSTLATVGGTSSIFTSLLGEMVYQFAAVATGEELLKFVAYTELKDRYKSMVLAVGVSVGFWAGFHALQAYKNVYYVIPAFICGMILLLLLETTKSIIAPIIAHGLYNTISILLSYASRTIPTNVPWFPTALTSEDVLLIGLAAMWIAFIILPILARRR
ncbi:MAG: CPBP family intramembrane glutamic endopeptidase [Candidatus Bathyarchaeia archaeon]